MFRVSRKLSCAISSAIISVIFISACSINDYSAEVIEVSIDFDVIGSAGPEARNHHTQIWIDESLIVWGGRPEGGGVLSDGAVLSGQKNDWKEISKAPISARSHHAGVAVDDRLFVWGGFSADGSGDQAKTGAFYSLEEDEWVEIEEAPEGRAAAQAEYVNGLVVISGGLTPTSDLLVFSVIDDSWRKVSFPENHPGYHVLGTDSFGDRVAILASDTEGFHVIDYSAGEDHVSIFPLRGIEKTFSAGISFSGKGALYIVSMDSMSSRLHSVSLNGKTELLFEDVTKTFQPDHLTSMHPFNSASMDSIGDRYLVSSGPAGVNLWDLESGQIVDLNLKRNSAFCGPLIVHSESSMIGWVGENECGSAGVVMDLSDYIY